MLSPVSSFLFGYEVISSAPDGLRQPLLDLLRCTTFGFPFRPSIRHEVNTTSTSYQRIPRFSCEVFWRSSRAAAPFLNNFSRLRG